MSRSRTSRRIGEEAGRSTVSVHEERRSIHLTPLMELTAASAGSDERRHEVIGGIGEDL